VIALPIGLRIGHTRRGAFLAINLGNAARALPSLGLLMIAVLLTNQIGFLPVLIALVALGYPADPGLDVRRSVRCRSGHDRRRPGGWG
jgi:osmoprotectant transport system permease protein